MHERSLKDELSDEASHAKNDNEEQTYSHYFKYHIDSKQHQKSKLDYLASECGLNVNFAIVTLQASLHGIFWQSHSITTVSSEVKQKVNVSKI